MQKPTLINLKPLLIINGCAYCMVLKYGYYHKCRLDLWPIIFFTLLRTLLYILRTALARCVFSFWTRCPIKNGMRKGVLLKRKRHSNRNRERTSIDRSSKSVVAFIPSNKILGFIFECFYNVSISNFYEVISFATREYKHETRQDTLSYVKSKTRNANFLLSIECT